MTTDDYRGRIYSRYVYARRQAYAAATVNALQPRAPDLRKLIRRHFPCERTARILDLGCGYGALIYFARGEGYVDIQGIDRSPEQTAVAQSLGVVGVKERDLLVALHDIRGESLDCVVTYDVIEHFAKSELLAFADEVLRVLRTGGRWIVHTPNGESPFCGRMRYSDFTHEIAFTRLSLSQLLLASGFTTVECYKDILAVTNVKRAIRWIIWQCIHSMLRVWLAAETGDIGRDAIFTQNLLAVAIK